MSINHKFLLSVVLWFGMNGATVVGDEGIGNLEIRPDNSLTTTWGQVKSESF